MLPTALKNDDDAMDTTPDVPIATSSLHRPNKSLLNSFCRALMIIIFGARHARRKYPSVSPFFLFVDQEIERVILL